MPVRFFSLKEAEKKLMLLLEMKSTPNTAQIKQTKSVSKTLKTNIGLYTSIILQPDIVHITHTPKPKKRGAVFTDQSCKYIFMFIYVYINFSMFTLSLHSLQPIYIDIMCVSVCVRES